MTPRRFPPPWTISTGQALGLSCASTERMGEAAGGKTGCITGREDHD